MQGIRQLLRQLMCCHRVWSEWEAGKWRPYTFGSDGGRPYESECMRHRRTCLACGKAESKLDIRISKIGTYLGTYYTP